MTTPRQWHRCGVVVVVVAVMMMTMTTTMETEGQRFEGKRTEIARLEKRLLQMLQDRVLQRRQEVGAGRGEEDYSSEEAGRRWMEDTNTQLLAWRHRGALASWNFFTNITPSTQSQFTAVSSQVSKWAAARRTEGRKFKVQLFDPDLQRQFWIFNLSSDPLDPDKLNQTMQLLTTMMSVYAEAKVCLNKHQHQHQHHQQQQQQPQTNKSHCLSLEPDLTARMAKSRDPEELKALWVGWRAVAGKPQRERYTQFVQLLNQGARDNGFRDYSQFWEQGQFLDTTTNVSAMLHELWGELRPLYLELHAYVRGRLRQRYGSAIMGHDGTIPAHLLGNMWAQDWNNIFDLAAPFPQLLQRPSNNADRLLQRRVTARGLFQLSDSFYRSMGLPPMTPTFWSKSMLVKPLGRQVQCHASAFDLFSPGDFRIKMCSSVTMQYLKTVHHEMGHVHYFMAYSPQPALYRSAPNQAFHEAIGDTAALSVMSKTHLQKLGLASPQESHGETMNQLLQMALGKIAFLPFSLVVDWWRWQVLQGKTLPSSYNHAWWKLRLDLQGIRSPVPRSEEDFDPAAKMHIVGNNPYLCYFVSFVVQFQFYEALCKTSGHTGPLYLCDFGNSTSAGDRFHQFMALGASQPWQKALKTLTGSDKVSTKSILEYFSPLRKWLQEHNAKTGEQLGWSGASVNWAHSH